RSLAALPAPQSRTNREAMADGRGAISLGLDSQEHQRRGGWSVAHRLIKRPTGLAGVEHDDAQSVFTAPVVDVHHKCPRETAVAMLRLGVNVVHKRNSTGDGVRPGRPRQYRQAAAGNDMAVIGLNEPRLVSLGRQHLLEPLPERAVYAVSDGSPHFGKHAQIGRA